MTAAVRHVPDLRPDAFLTERLGRPCFTLVGAEHAGADRRGFPLAIPEPAFVTAKLPCTATIALAALQRAGFRVVDTALTFEAPVAALAMPRGAAMARPARPEDEAAVRAIAGSAFTRSRFHLDPDGPDAAANQVKADWAGNFFSGQRGDGMLVVERQGGGVAGFLQWLKSGEDALVIDLIGVAPDATGQGLGAVLVAAASGEPAPGFRPARIIVGTQAANIGSCRFYEKLGFRLAGSAHVLHHHGQNREGMGP